MARVIISGLGLSRKNAQPGAGGYVRTVYEVNGIDYPPTPLFIDTLRDVYQPETVIIFGTRTSSWGVLLDDYMADPAAEALFNEIEQATADQQRGVSDDQLQRLSEYLQPHWETATILKALVLRDVSDETATAVLDTFVGLLLAVPPEDEIIFDITFTLRSLQMLAFSAVQVCAGFVPGFLTRVTMMYGDISSSINAGPPRRNADGSIEPTRGKGVLLHSLRQISEAAHAAAVFEQSLNAMPLVELLKRDGSSELAAALENFSLAAANNHFDRLPKSIRQLEAALGDANIDTLAYGRLLRRRLTHLVGLLKHDTLFATLVAFAEQRAARSDFALAIFALFEAVVSLAVPDSVEDYESMKDGLLRLRSCLSQKEDNQLTKLEYARNRVAHGIQRIAAQNDINPPVAYREGIAFIRSTNWTLVTEKLQLLRQGTTPATPIDVVVEVQTEHLPSIELSGVLPLIRTTALEHVTVVVAPDLPESFATAQQKLLPAGCRIGPAAEMTAEQTEPGPVRLVVRRSKDVQTARVDRLNDELRLQWIRSVLAPIMKKLQANPPQNFAPLELIDGITTCFIILDQITELYSDQPVPQAWIDLSPEQRYLALSRLPRYEEHESHLRGTATALSSLPLIILIEGLRRRGGNRIERPGRLPATLQLLRRLANSSTTLLTLYLRRTGRLAASGKLAGWLSA